MNDNYRFRTTRGVDSPRLATLLALALAIFGIAGAVAKASTLPPESGLHARSLAENVPWNQPRQAITHPLGVQTLSVERKEIKREPDTSLINVYQFNYPLEQARLISVDISDERILANQAIESVHLPLNDNEISFARELLSSQEDILAQLRDEQVRRGVSAFVELSQLDVKASVFEPLDTSHPCYRQRCALMSLFDQTRTVFSIEPVINLQTIQVDLLKR